MSESQSNPSLYVSLSPSPFSPGAVKIKDCHAKWPDTRGQRGGGRMHRPWGVRGGRGCNCRSEGETVRVDKGAGGYSSKSIYSILWGSAAKSNMKDRLSAGL